MSQHKIMTQLQLKTNHKGTFCADIDVSGQQLIAYLSNKLIENQQLYTTPLEGNVYWASINISNGKAYINQLLPLTEYSDDTPSLKYHGYCQKLTDGRIQLRLENDNGYIILPKSAVYSWLYRIFYNSDVIVTFSHDAKARGGFKVQDWQLQNSLDIAKGIVTNIHIKEDGSGQYLADYYVDGKDSNTFLSVMLFKRGIQKLGIDSIKEQACLSASISFDDANRRSQITLLVSPEELLKNFNQPKAKLSFTGTKKTKKNNESYKFVTQWVNGIRLSVSAWESELNYYVEDVSKLQQEDTIDAHLTYQQNKGWVNFKLPVAGANEYQEVFRCITMKTVNNEEVVILEICKAPYSRVMFAQSELIKKGIYAIKSSVEFKLHIKRTPKKSWVIKAIDSSLFMGIKSKTRYKSKSTVVSPWSRYKNAPEYLIQRLDRSYLNYAYSNHCMAKVSTRYADLLLMIPKALLIKSEFRILAINDIVEVVFKKIEFPVFETKPMPILCADQVLSREPPQQSINDGLYVYIDILKQLPPVNSKNKYYCMIVDSEDTLDLIDWSDQLKGISEPSQYRYKVRVTESQGKRKVKEIISASIK